MSNRFIGFLLIFIGLFAALPVLLKFLFRFLFVAVGCYLIYIGLQKIEAHYILFYIDRMISKFMGLFS